MVCIFRRLALNDQRVGPMTGDRSAGEQVCSRQMLDRRHKSSLAPQPLVPESLPSAVSRCYVNLIHWREAAHPWISFRNGPRIPRKKQRHLWILKIAHPVRYPKMQQIQYRRNSQPSDLCHHLIGPAPVKSIRAEVNAMIREPIAQTGDPHLLHELQVFSPSFEMPALGQQISPKPPAISVCNHWIRTFDARGECKVPGSSAWPISLGPNALGGRPSITRTD